MTRECGYRRARARAALLFKGLCGGVADEEAEERLFEGKVWRGISAWIIDAPLCLYDVADVCMLLLFKCLLFR